MSASGRDGRYDGWGDGRCAWRRPAPSARRAARALYAWREPGWTFLFSIVAAAPFAAAAALAPALLSLSPTLDMLAPVAEARAVAAGDAGLAERASPFYLLLLMAGDLFAEAPGRVHLAAKAIAGLFIALPLAYLASSRFPAAHAVVLTAGLAAYAAAPFSGPAELGLAMLLACAVACACACADASLGRARFEGVLVGAIMFALWLLHPAFALAGFALLSVCPFVSGRCGLQRYAAALIVLAALAAAAELAAPGLNAARAHAASEIFALTDAFAAQTGAHMGAAAFSAMLVLGAAAIFGGREHVWAWGSAAGVAVVAFAAARAAGADAAPVFALAAGVACFSVASPFYDGVFRDHDRASVSMGLTVAALTLFWSGTLAAQAAGQFALQRQTAQAAPDDIRRELALVQPGGPTVSRWLEEGRFSTVEARKYFALSPVDQSAMLLEAAERARGMTRTGLDVAILAGADVACLLTERRACRADGPDAARRADVVFAPRLDLGPAATAAKGRAEALLYTEFKLTERTALWEIWVRRDGPPALLQPPGAEIGLYR